MNNNLSALISAYNSLREEQKKLVLVTLIETQGSSYRKAGARMLIDSAGKYYGMLGNEKLHTFLNEHAQQILESHDTLVVCYREPPTADSQEVSLLLLLQYLSSNNGYQPLETIAAAIKNRKRDVLITVYESEYDGLKIGTDIFLSNIEEYAELEEHVRDEVRQIAEEVNASGKALHCEHFVNNHSVSLFYNPAQPPLSLLILGSGPDTLVLIHFAKQLGWHVTLADLDSLVQSSELFFEADEVNTITANSEAISSLLAKAETIVIMSHNIEKDVYFLQNALACKNSYIGLLASTVHRDKIFEALNIGKKELKNRVHSPAGLKLGGDLPEDIALSITAEIQQVTHEKTKTSSRLEPVIKQSKILDELAVVILAAGGSTRFGGLKQLLEYKGMSLLRRAVETAIGLVEPEQIYVILGPKELKMQRELTKTSVNIISNTNWESGVASSIKAGLRALPTKYTGMLALLCDQPLITTQHLQQLSTQWEKNQDKIIASYHMDICTEPAIIPRKFFQEISKLYKDQGITKLIEIQREAVTNVSLPEAAMNVDTQEDYMKLLVEV